MVLMHTCITILMTTIYQDMNAYSSAVRLAHLSRMYSFSTGNSSAERSAT